MLRLKIILFIVIMIQSLSAQWLERKNGLPSTINVRGGTVIEPVDSLIAFITVDDGKFYKTSDSGLNWYNLTTPTFPSELSIEDIAAFSEDSIWICGYSDTTTSIYSSLDGGASWVNQYRSTEGILFYIEMFSGDSGVAAGYAYEDSPAPMIQTTDGGINWIKKNEEYLINSHGLTNGIDIVDMDFIVFQEKWWTLSKSLDGGASWDSIYTTTGGQVVDFYDRKFGLLATVFGEILRSFDGGITWEKIYQFPLNTPRCIEYLPENPSKIWLSIEWQLYFSEDSGKTWTEYPFEGDFWSSDIEFVDNKHGWIVANDMVYYTNTGDRIVTSVDGKFHIPAEYILHQNYPNPFNPSTQIRYSISKSEHVNISVYNGIGQLVESLQNNKMPAGKHEVNFSAEHLSSGIYYYKIKAGNFLDVKKMIYIK